MRTEFPSLFVSRRNAVDPEATASAVHGTRGVRPDGVRLGVVAISCPGHGIAQQYSNAYCWQDEPLSCNFHDVLYGKAATCFGNRDRSSAIRVRHRAALHRITLPGSQLGRVPCCRFTLSTSNGWFERILIMLSSKLYIACSSRQVTSSRRHCIVSQ